MIHLFLSHQLYKVTRGPEREEPSSQLEGALGKGTSHRAGLGFLSCGKDVFDDISLQTGVI